MALTQVGGSGIGSATATGTFAVTGVHTVGNNAIYTSDGGAVTQNLVQGSLKAWHRADGDASTVAFNDSYNFASITDNGTGNYTSTFTNAMNNANYSISVESDMGGSNGGFNALNKSNSSASAVRTYSFTDAGSFRDVDPILLMVAGDLA
tara:strand:+ start:31 stop:480 length:450 start_codon:yes stop_codon:yes gene_type:complete